MQINKGVAPMRCHGTLLVAFLVFATGASAQQPPKPNQDPDAARLVTSDISSFWRVFDKASLKDAAELFQHEYIDPGTAGLYAFLKSRIQNGRYLASTIAARPRYYAAIRESTLAVDHTPALKEAIRASFRRLKEIYPDAVFPDVYFVIGRMNSAGTVSSSGLLIGVEMNARTKSTPLEELTDWERAVIGQSANLPNIVAHELIHIQQPHDSVKTTLLQQALSEDAADFVGEMITGASLTGHRRHPDEGHRVVLA